MIKKKIALLSFGLLFLAGAYAYACGGSSCSGSSCGGGCSCGKVKHANHQCSDMSVTEIPVKAVDVGNKNCPIEGAKIGSMGDPVKITYKGKIYNLCCASCLEKFQVDPEKYSKVSEDMK